MKICLSARSSSKMGDMWLVAGLGNPGEKYVNTRHNTGFEMVDALASYNNIKIKKVKFHALVGDGKVGGASVVLAKPQTYMNLSGESIKAIANHYKIPPERIIIIYDEAALETGKVRIRTKGSAGGHNGIKNIIAMLGTEEFIRLRVGIGASEHDIIDYVLGKFTKKEIETLTETAVKIPEIVEEIIRNGAVSAMNKYN